jgi:hypothetical protein
MLGLLAITFTLDTCVAMIPFAAYRSLAGFRTAFFWVVSAPLSTLVHFELA